MNAFRIHPSIKVSDQTTHILCRWGLHILGGKSWGDGAGKESNLPARMKSVYRQGDCRPLHRLSTAPNNRTEEGDEGDGFCPVVMRGFFIRPVQDSNPFTTQSLKSLVSPKAGRDE